MVSISQYSVILLLFCLICSCILFMISIVTTAWVEIFIEDSVQLRNKNSSTEIQLLLLSIDYSFGLSSYCVKVKNLNTSSVEKSCAKLSGEGPGILNDLDISVDVLLSIRKFMALTIIITTLAGTSSIVGKWCTKERLSKIIAYCSIGLIASAGLACSASIIICSTSIKIPPSITNTSMKSKHGEVHLHVVRKGYSFYMACLGNLFILIAVVLYFAELKYIRRKENEDEEISYKMLSSSSMVD